MQQFENAGSEQEIVTNSHPYKIDGEVGRFEFSTHSAIDNKTKSILFQNNFTSNGCFQGDNQTYLQNIAAMLTKEEAGKAAEDFSDKIKRNYLDNMSMDYQDHSHWKIFLKMAGN